LYEVSITMAVGVSRRFNIEKKIHIDSTVN